MGALAFSREDSLLHYFPYTLLMRVKDFHLCVTIYSWKNDLRMKNDGYFDRFMIFYRNHGSRGSWPF